MIIVKLNGGLGNQMFQYSAGRNLAEIHGVELKMDLTAFDTCKKRKYALWPFNIKENIASPEEITSLKFYRDGVVSAAIRTLLGKPLKFAPTYVRERALFQFDPELLHKYSDVYLEGSWQNEKYFKDVEKIICSEFVLKSPQTVKHKELIKQISSCESVNLHIRRGDYASEAKTRAFHGLCGLNYYYNAVEWLKRRVENPHFFVFSDDLDWARNNLKIPYPITFMDHNGPDEGHADMHLMSKCKYHIIANSSFSWWGAWLGNSPHKLVISPRCWLISDKLNTTDLIPKDWIKL